MTTREKSLTLALGGMLGGGLLLGVAYLLVLSPWLEKSRQVRKLEDDIRKRQDEVLDLELMIKKHEASRKQSLPADVKLSRGKYADLLNNLIRQADFPTGYKVTVAEPNSKSAPLLAPKKPAYTMLTYEISGKADVYHLVDFLQRFYAQPMLHSIKKINVLRPTDARSRERRELDVTMTVEALVLDNAQDRPTLLPTEPSIAAVASVAGTTGLSLATAQAGVSSGFAPKGVLATPSRTYLATAGKNVFFGPTPEAPIIPERPKPEDNSPPQEDSMPFIVLTSIVGYSDGKLVASLRDKLTDTDYIVTQHPSGKITVYSTLRQRDPMTGERMDNYYGRNEIICGTESGKNRHAWRVRRVNLLDIILEQQEDKEPEKGTFPKPKSEALVAGGIYPLIDVTEGKMAKLHLGQTLDKPELLLSREARRAIYAPPLVAPEAEISAQDKGR